MYVYIDVCMYVCEYNCPSMENTMQAKVLLFLFTI